MPSRWDSITVKLQNAVAICLSDCAITVLMHGMHAEWPDIICHPGWVATHSTQGTYPVLQHCSGITTVAPFTFTCDPVIDPIQRYDRWAAHWSSRLIANQNQPRETDMRVPEIQKAFQKWIGQHPEAPCQGASEGYQILFWNALLVSCGVIRMAGGLWGLGKVWTRGMVEVSPASMEHQSKQSEVIWRLFGGSASFGATNCCLGVSGSACRGTHMCCFGYAHILVTFHRTTSIISIS